MRLGSIEEKHDILLQRSAAATESDTTGLEVIEEEKLSTQKCLQICEQLSKYIHQNWLTLQVDASSLGLDDSQTDSHLRENISIIENHGTGDVVQFMISANGKVLHGKNRALGWRARQYGGYLSNYAVINLARQMSGITLSNTGDSSSPRDDSLSRPGGTVESSQASDFEKRWGPGRTQMSNPITEGTAPSAKATEYKQPRSTKA